MKRQALVFLICILLLMTACGSAEPQPATTTATQEAAETTAAQETTAAETTTAVSTTAAETTTSAPETTEAETTAAPETTEAPPAQGFTEQGKVLLDNELAKITLNDEITESSRVGYSLTIENMSGKNILVTIDKGSVDGVMQFIDLQKSTVSAGKKSKAEMWFYTSNSDIKSLDDLKNIEGSFAISTNTDGGNSYTGSNERYPFEIIGRAGGSSSQSDPVEGNTLLDNEMLTIVLTGTIEERSYVGYSLRIENKSNKYILVRVENGSVDGFMTFIDMQGSIVSPGKKANAEMRFYSSSSDVKSLDDLKNVEGFFAISTNTDGGSSYSGGESYPFAIAGSGSDKSSDVPESTEKSAAETTPASDNLILLGEAISTDDWDFTVNKVEFTYELKPKNTSGVYSSYTAPEGKVYIHIDATYYNKSKRDICIRDLPVPTADYNDGYRYEGFAVTDRDDNSFFWVDSYVVSEPLTTCHYHGLIECPKIVKESKDPLFITIKMSNGSVYRYDIR